MRKGIHPVTYKINFLTSKKNSFKILFTLDIDKLKTDLDIYTNKLYNRMLISNIPKDSRNIARLRLFKL